MTDKKKSKLKRKLKVAVIDEASYEQYLSLRLSLFNIIVWIGGIGILLVAGVTLLIAFTSLREYIPGYPSGEERRLIIDNMQRADSLILEIRLRDMMVSNLRAALAGDLPIEACNPDSVRPKRNQLLEVVFSKSDADSIFRAEVEQEELFDVETQQQMPAVGSSAVIDPEMMFLFTPVKGIITNKFGDSTGHFGVDVASAEGTPVQSILDGTVILSEWTVETGYVVEVQHDNNLVSVYKHNAKLLKRAGQRVKAGEAIAFSGNSGELSTGPHLHFELWYSGMPLNPENYIDFE